MVALLFADNEPLDLYPGQSINLKKDSQFLEFGLKAAWSLPFSLPPTPRNNAKLKQYRFAETSNNFVYLSVELHLVDGARLPGSLKCKWEDGRYSCTVFTKELEVLNLLKTTKLFEVTDEKIVGASVDINGHRTHRKYLDLPTEYRNGASYDAEFLSRTYVQAFFGDESSEVYRFITSIPDTINLLINGGIDGAGDAKPAFAPFADSNVTGNLFTFAKTDDGTDIEYNVAIWIYDIGVGQTERSEVRNELFWLHNISSVSYVDASVTATPSDKICFPMILSEKLAEDTNLFAEDQLYYVGSKPKYINAYNTVEGNYEDSNLISPCLFLNYVLERIATLIGLKLSGSFVDDTETDNLILFSGVVSEYLAVFDLKNYLPDITVSVFLKQLLGHFCLDLDFDLFNNRLVLDYRTDRLNATPQQADRFLLADPKRREESRSGWKLGYKNKNLNSLSSEPLENTQDFEIANDYLPARFSEGFRVPFFEGDPIKLVSVAYNPLNDVDNNGNNGSMRHQDPGITTPERSEQVTFLFWNGLRPNADGSNYPLASFDNLDYNIIELGDYSLAIVPLKNDFWNDYLNALESITDKFTFKGLMKAYEYSVFEARTFELQGMVFMTAELEGAISESNDIPVEIECYRIK